MTKKRYESHNAQSNLISRKVYISIIQASLAAGHDRFTLDACLNWLGSYPGDLEVGFLYAKGLIANNRKIQALPILEGISKADPEYYAVVETLDSYFREIPQNNSIQGKMSNRNRKYATWLYTLNADNHKSKITRNYQSIRAIDEWGKYLRHALLAVKSGNIDQAEKLLILALGSNPPMPLVHLSHLKYLSQQENIPLAAKLNLARHYREIWPSCLTISLLLAHWMMEGGEHDQAVNLIHQTMARDISGQVPSRLWGQNNPYKSIWSTDLELTLAIPIPADVAVKLGWNQLPDRATSILSTQLGDAARSSPLPDFLSGEFPKNHSVVDRKAQKYAGSLKGETNPENASKRASQQKVLQIARIELEKLARQISQPGLTQFDGRYPVYVVLTNKSKLEEKFGLAAAENILSEMQNVATSISNRSLHDETFNWVGKVYLADDPSITHLIGLNPVEKSDPWKIKLSLVDLDNALAKRGEMIGALLIVGGPEIVPFHHLPNPIDDPDDFVASDNPYGTRDENYFMLEWPVGRLPSGRGTDPNLLINSLLSIQLHHSNRNINPSWFRRILNKIDSLFHRNGVNGSNSIGYSAAVWRNASQSVYRPIGNPSKLVTSPPMGINGHKSSEIRLPSLSSSRLGYFNLHGIIDASEWYGQSDNTDTNSDPDYPIALRPQDIRRRGKISSTILIPEIIFSEACYGAHITDKSVEEAISLTFLSQGNSAFIGSTSMSYGSVNPPLIAADLLGHSFWQYLRDGLFVGEALRQAKIHLANVMNERQGYLDGEDQKSLISFIQFGDPLSQFIYSDHKIKTISRMLINEDELVTICDRYDGENNGKNIPPNELEIIKQIVAQYLPGMGDAQVMCSAERSVCHAEGHICPTSQLQGDFHLNNTPSRKVYTLSKHVIKNSHQHKTYARITIDVNGKVVKFVVSR